VSQKDNMNISFPDESSLQNFLGRDLPLYFLTLISVLIWGYNVWLFQVILGGKLRVLLKKSDFCWQTSIHICYLSLWKSCGAPLCRLGSSQFHWYFVLNPLQWHI
jgi:hypothetical protein